MMGSVGSVQEHCSAQRCPTDGQGERCQPNLQPTLDLSFFGVFVPKHPPGKVHGTEIKQSWLTSPKGQLSPRAILLPDLCRNAICCWC